MKKKTILIMIVSVAVLLSACKGAEQTKPAQATSDEIQSDVSKEEAGEEISKTTAEETAIEDTDTVQEETEEEIPYAEDQGLEYTFSLADCMSYSGKAKFNFRSFLLDEDFNEVSDDVFFTEDGFVDYYGDVKKSIHPAEEDGYRTLVISYGENCTSLVHMSQKGGENIKHILFETPQLIPFDYYTGEIFPVVFTTFSQDENDTSEGESELPEKYETTVSFGDKESKVTTMLKNKTISLKPDEESPAFQFTDESKGLYVCPYVYEARHALIITYPEDYDGLCFAMDRNLKEYEYDREEGMKSLEGEGWKDDIGKKILEKGKKDDYCFFTTKIDTSVSATESDDIVEIDKLLEE